LKRDLLSHSYEALRAYFKPLRGLWSLHTGFANSELSNPGGYSMYTSLFKKPFKEAHLTSIWNDLMLVWDVNVNNMQMASNLATCAKV